MTVPAYGTASVPGGTAGNATAAANVNAEAGEGGHGFAAAACALSQRPARGEAL